MPVGGPASFIWARLRLGGCSGLRMLLNKFRRGFWAFLVLTSLFMIAHFTVFLINKEQTLRYMRQNSGNGTLLFVEDGLAPHSEPQDVNILPPEVMAENTLGEFSGVREEDISASEAIPLQEGLAPNQGEIPAPEGEIPAPEGEVPIPEGEIPVPEEENPPREEADPLQDGNALSLEGEVPVPEGDAPQSKGEIQPPEGENPPPEGIPPQPEGEGEIPVAEGESSPVPPEQVDQSNNPLTKYGDPKNLNNRYHYPTLPLPEFFRPGPDSPFMQRKSGWDYSNLLEVDPPPYLPNFRSPCWMEELDNPFPYTDNWMYHDFEYEPTYLEMEKRWADKMGQGQNWRLRCLPSYFIAGMAKCGTTELYDKLALHPQVVTGAMKEPHWWTRYRLGWTNDGYVPISNYVDMYDKASEQIYNYSEWRGEEEWHPHIFGDGSVTTLYQNDYWYDLPENAGHPEGPRYLVTHYIQHLLPKSKFLVMLRHPADRLFSDYLFFEWRSPKSVEEFHEFVLDSIQKMNECLEHRSLYSCIHNATLHKISKLHLRDGLYFAYLKEYLEIWPRDQVFVTRLEDYKQDRSGTLTRVCEFLGLDPMPEEVLKELDELGVSNARQGYNLAVGQMWDKTRKILEEFHRPYNEQLAELLGDEKYLWNER